MITGINTQDTLKPSFVIRINTENLLSDSIFNRIQVRDDAVAGLPIRSAATPPAKEHPVTDTAYFVYRNITADVNFYDSLNFIRNLDLFTVNRFPFGFEEKKSLNRNETKTVITGNLKDGWLLPGKIIHNDWLTIMIFVAVLLYVLVIKNARSVFQEIPRFFMLKGISDPSSRDTGTIFYWESTVLNFVSFLILSLFAFCAASWYDFIPSGLSAVSFTIIAFLIIVAAITLRHFICIVTGNLTGESAVFNEYLVSIYLSYRFAAIPVFILVILLTYTTFLKPQVYFPAGVVILIILYIYRILRLFLIFVKSNVSIFYLILYLCALEILPVLLLLKYFTGIF